MFALSPRRFALLSSLALLPGLLAGCADLCGNEVSAQILSPDSKLKAVTFSRDCGATTGFSTQISVLPAGESLSNDIGNVFVLDKGDSIRLEWQGNRRLLVHHAPTSFKSEKQISVPTGWFRHENVAIVYVK